MIYTVSSKKILKKYIKKECDSLKSQNQNDLDMIDAKNAKECTKWELSLNVLLKKSCIDLMTRYYKTPDDWIMAVKNSDEITNKINECKGKVPPGLFP